MLHDLFLYFTVHMYTVATVAMRVTLWSLLSAIRLVLGAKIILYIVTL